MYLDPGFGSMIIQFIVAAIAAGGVYFAIFRKKIVAMFRRKHGTENTDDETPPDEE